MPDVCAAWGTCSLPRNHAGPCAPADRSQERPPIDVEQIVRAALRIVDQTTPLSVGEPLVQRILSSLSPHNREADHE